MKRVVFGDVFELGQEVDFGRRFEREELLGETMGVGDWLIFNHIEYEHIGEIFEQLRAVEWMVA